MRKPFYVEGLGLSIITVSLICVKGLYLGIKVTLSNNTNYTDSGVFLTVNQEEWKKPGFEIERRPTVFKATKKGLSDTYTLVQHLKETKAKRVLDMIIVGKNTRGLYLYSKFDGYTVVDLY